MDSGLTDILFLPQAYGAVADGETYDTGAMQRCIDACAESGGGMVYLKPGRYLTGPLYLKKNVNLHIEAGAVILGSPDRSDYAIVTRRSSGTTGLNLEALINVDSEDNVTISGRGTIDGQGQSCWAMIRDYFQTPKSQRPVWQSTPGTEEFIRESIWARPVLVEPVKCHNLVIREVTLKNPCFWTLHPIFCENVTIEGIRIDNPDHANNSDGIDLDSCRNVTVSNCIIQSGDDCLALKSGTEGDAKNGIVVPTENVTISNCVMLRGHGGVTIGSDMSGGVRNVTVSNCAFDGTETGIRLKTLRGRGGAVENINYQNIVMNNVVKPIVMNMHYWKKTEPGPVDEWTPQFRNLFFSQIIATAATEAACLDGLEEQPIDNVMMSQVSIEAERAFSARYVSNLALRDLDIKCPVRPERVFESVGLVNL